MSGPLGWWQSLPERITQIILGLLIGTLGRYGLSISEGEEITVKMIVTDLLFQGIFGAISVAITSAMNLTGQAAVFVGAMVALNGARIVRLVRDQFFDKAKDRLGAKPDGTEKAAAVEFADTLKASDGLAELPPPPAANVAPTAAQLVVFRGNPRAAGVERLAEGHLPKTAGEFTNLLDQVDAADNASRA